jgi:hypothetical protein
MIEKYRLTLKIKKATRKGRLSYSRPREGGAPLQWPEPKAHAGLITTKARLCKKISYQIAT